MGTSQAATAPRRILLIVDKCQAGDALRISFCMRAVRERYSDAEIVVLASETAAPIFEGSEAFGRVVRSRLYSLESSSLLGLRLRKAAELLRLRRQLGPGYDLVIIFWWGSTLLRLLARLVGRGRRIGYAARGSLLLTSRLGPFNFRTDELAQHVRLLEEADVRAPLLPTLTLLYTRRDVTAAREMLRRHGLALDRPLVVLHPGSDWACQQWLPARWAEVADALAARYGVQLVFTGVEAERPAIEAIRGAMNSVSVSLAGLTTFAELGAVLSLARLCVSVDSAAFVASRAVGTPTLVLAGPSRPGRVPGPAPMAVVSRASVELKEAIARSREARFSQGRCQNWDCPMAGLREIAARDVLAAVEGQRHLLQDSGLAVGTRA